MNDSLIDFVLRHTGRGACICGRCADAPANPKNVQPTGEHTADLVFFKVCAIDSPNAEDFVRYLIAHKGVHCECNPLDGKEHGYMELGGWIGDQGTALMCMGLGAILGIWCLFTPYTVLPGIPEHQALDMAGAGYITVKARSTETQGEKE